MSTSIFKFLIIIATVSLFSSCFRDQEEVEFSNDPTFYSLNFAKNDSIPGLEKAVFTLEDSIIVNLDSLPFQTRIDSVFPTFSFKSSAISYLIMRDSMGSGLDTVFLTGKDTINFNRVIRVVNLAADRIEDHKSTYKIKVNVHQVAPELYVWRRKVSEINPFIGNIANSIQKVVFFKNKFFLYQNAGAANSLFTSDNALQWVSQNLNGLPVNSNLSDINEYSDKLYMVHADGKIYSSADGYNWTGTDPGKAGYTINNLLFVLDNNLWSVFKQQLTQQYYFSTSTDGVAWQINEKVQSDFPITDFGAYAFASKNNRPKAIVVGGYDDQGNLLNSVWTIQKNINDEYKWLNLAKDSRGALKPLAGTAIIGYDNKLLLFGGMAADKSIIGNAYMESIDEGLTWRKTDTINNVIEDLTVPLTYQPRSYQSVVHDTTSHYIYLFGGKTNERVFSDVWVGKLNRLSFAR